MDIRACGCSCNPDYTLTCDGSKCRCECSGNTTGMLHILHVETMHSRYHDSYVCMQVYSYQS